MGERKENWAIADKMFGKNKPRELEIATATTELMRLQKLYEDTKSSNKQYWKQFFWFVAGTGAGFLTRRVLMGMAASGVGLAGATWHATCGPTPEPVERVEPRQVHDSKVPIPAHWSTQSEKDTRPHLIPADHVKDQVGHAI